MYTILERLDFLERMREEPPWWPNARPPEAVIAPPSPRWKGVVYTQTYEHDYRFSDEDPRCPHCKELASIKAEIEAKIAADAAARLSAGNIMDFSGLSVCHRCGGHGVVRSDGAQALCHHCVNGIVGPLDHPHRRWAEYFHSSDGIHEDAAREYDAAGFAPSHAHSAWLLDWPASSGIVDIEAMRAHSLRDVKVELVCGRRSA